MTSKSVDASKSGQVVKATPVQRLIDRLALEAEMFSGEDTGDYVESILSTMIEAPTLEDAIEAQNSGSTGGKDLVGVELEVRSFYVLKATDRYKSPLKHYLIVNDVIRLDTLEQSPFNTGAPNLVINFLKARDTDRLPLQCVIRSREVANGDLLTLELLPKRPLNEPGF